MFYKGNATLFYRDAGDIFDQIMISETLIQKTLLLSVIGKPEFTTNLLW